jgi:hypothetical protein
MRLLYGVWTRVGSDRCSSIIQRTVIFCSLITKMKVLDIFIMDEMFSDFSHDPGFSSLIYMFKKHDF